MSPTRMRAMVLLLVWTLGPLSTAVLADSDPSGNAADKSLVALNKWLEHFPHMPPKPAWHIAAVADPAVRKVLPDQTFYVVCFYKDFPRPGLLPPELELKNLIRVGSDGHVERFTSLKALEDYLKKHLPSATDEKQVRNAAVAALRLAEGFHQDGHYTFEAGNHGPSATRRNDRWETQAEAKVVGGGRGNITASVSYEPSGKVQGVKLSGQIVSGPRRR